MLRLNCILFRAKKGNDKMKKRVIWCFGESATGKETLIKNILKNQDNIQEIFGLDGLKIDVIDRTIMSNLSAFDDKNNEIMRQKVILEKLTEFSENACNILLIKGQTNDMDDRFGNTLHTAKEMFLNLEQEIWLLEVSDLDLHYERLLGKDWYCANKDKYEAMGWDKNWLARKVLEHRQKVLKCAKEGFEIKLIDSTKEYKIMKGRK